MLLLVDGDVVAYLSCKSRFISEDASSELVVISKGTFEFSKEENRKYMEDCWNNFNKIIETVAEATFATDVLVAVKSEHNFRDFIYSGYKKNRKRSENYADSFVPALRSLAIFEEKAIEAKGREADDLLCIWATQAQKAGDPFVIASIDKDLKCIPGTHYNLKTNKKEFVEERDAKRFFYQQLLSGDPTDNIPGLPGIGPVKAKAFLSNLSVEESFQEIVVEQYIHAFEEDWYNQLLSNGKMLYLQTHENDFFKISHWPIVSSLHFRKEIIVEERKLKAPSLFSGSIPKL